MRTRQADVSDAVRDHASDAIVSDVTFTFSDFRAVGGVQLPHTIVRRLGPMRATWSITSWEINPMFSATDFAAVRR